MTECSSTSNSETETDKHYTGAHHVLEGIKLPFHKFLHPTTSDHNDHGHTSGWNASEGPSSIPYQQQQQQTDTKQKLRFNGAGVRSVNFFGWDFKVYVAGFYHAAQHVIEDAEAVFTAVNHHPMQLDFTFLRSVNQGRVTEAWQKQLAHSVENTYDGFEKDRDQFVSCFGPIENGGTESVVLLQDGRTVIVDQGVMKGVIYNKQFQRAFLSMWFGTNAVAPDLKHGLLGGIGHYGLQHHRTQQYATVVEPGAATVAMNGGTESMEK